MSGASKMASFVRSENGSIPEVVTVAEEIAGLLLVKNMPRLVNKKLKFLGFIWLAVGSVWVIIYLVFIGASGINRVAYLGFVFWCLSAICFGISFALPPPKNETELVARIDIKRSRIDAFGESKIVEGSVEKIVVLAGKDIRRVPGRGERDIIVSWVRQVVVVATDERGVEVHIVLLSGILSKKFVQKFVHMLSRCSKASVVNYNI